MDMKSKRGLKNQFLITILFSLLLSTILIGTSFVVGLKNRRFYNGKPLKTNLTKGEDFIKELEKRKIKGREVIILANSFYAEIPQFVPTADGQTNINNLASLLDYRKVEPTNNNFIYVAILKGLVREVYLYLPEEEWKMRKFDFWSPFLKLKGNYLLGTYFEGTPFTISSVKNLNFIKEKTVLIVNPELFPDWKKFLNKIQADIIFLLKLEK